MVTHHLFRASALNRFKSSKCFCSTSSVPFEKVVFSGIQPTGVPHLGNYLGALQAWVQLQDHAIASTRFIFSIADLHAITMRQDSDQLRQWKMNTLATLLSVGLNPARCIIYFQSDVSAHTELMWILCCTTSVGYLSRMTQWKSKLALAHTVSLFDQGWKANLKLGQFSYPVLQAADILVHGATHVPVGDDQQQHLEFARSCATTFNSIHGEVLKQPVTVISPAKRVMSLKEPRLKMSKSHTDPRSRILISDTSEEIRMKIKFGLTDSICGITYDTETRPGVSNILQIMSHLSENYQSPEDLANECRNMSMQEFKERASNLVVDHIGPIQHRYSMLIKSENSSYLEHLAKTGAERARDNAISTLSFVRKSIGLSQ